MTIPERDIMAGLAKGLRVIESFTAEQPRQSISQVSSASGLDRATARRCLLTLTREGYADWDGKYFTLTPRVLRLGTACLATMPLPQIVQPQLDLLSDRIGESSSVSILDGDEIVYVARAAQRKVMSIALMPGSRLPAYCTSMGRVMLAALPDSAVRPILGAGPFLSRSPKTLTEVEEVLREIAITREAGYALVDEEVELGLRSIAVPLFDAFGRVVAAVNVGVAAGQFSPADLYSRFLNQLLAFQTELRGVLR